MDDYSVSSLSESKNEWCARLVNLMTPAVLEGLKSIFEEAWQICEDNDEEDKYLMTFQTYLSRIPNWNSTIIETERKRIEKSSSCAYLEELIACVHVIQLKALTCVRVGQEQKKVDIDIPNPDMFVHKVYINVARKLYTNIYLYEKDISPLNIQKHNRELELIIKECILESIRDTMPIEKILKAYMDETEEIDTTVKDELLVEKKNDDVDVINEDNKTENTVIDNIVIEKIGEPSNNTDNSSLQLTSDTSQMETTDENSAHTTEMQSVATPAMQSAAMQSTAMQSAAMQSAAMQSAAMQSAAIPATQSVSQTITTMEEPTHTYTTAQTKTNFMDASPIKEPIYNEIDRSEQISFSDNDRTLDHRGRETIVDAPKTIDRLETISANAAEMRRLQEMEDDEEERLNIGDEVKLEIEDINDLNRNMNLNSLPLLEDIEILH